MMQCIEDPKLRLPRGIQDLQHMRNAVIRFCNTPNVVPYLASLGNEVVIRIDHAFPACRRLRYSATGMPPQPQFSISTSWKTTQVHSGGFLSTSNRTWLSL